jgi:hypothetical protein
MKKCYLKQEAREKLKAAIEDFKNGDFELDNSMIHYWEDGRVHYVVGQTKSGFIFTCFDCGLDFDLIAKDQIQEINNTLDAEYLVKQSVRAGSYSCEYYTVDGVSSYTLRESSIETKLGLALNDLASRLSNRGLFAS